MIDRLSPRLINAALVARKSLDQNQELPVNKYDFLSSNASNWRRSVSLFRLINEHFPNSINKAIELSLNTRNLPLENKELEFLGNGGEQIVFKVKDSANVLKINRQSLLTPDSEVDNTALKTLREYQTISNWYKNSDILIPHQSFLSIQIKNLVMNKKVCAILEPFDNSPRVDFFLTPEVEILEIAHKDTTFKNSLIQFLRVSLANFDNNGLIMDLNGDTNVCIKNTEIGKKIWLTDPHIIYDTQQQKEKKSPKTWIKLHEKIKILRSAQQHLSSN